MVAKALVGPVRNIYGYVMENGRIILQGTGQELLNNSHVKQAYLGI